MGTLSTVITNDIKTRVISGYGITHNPMPLSELEKGCSARICYLKGHDKSLRFLESLGFVEGSLVQVVTKLSGNLIVKIRGSRVALGQVVAKEIFVTE